MEGHPTHDKIIRVPTIRHMMFPCKDISFGVALMLFPIEGINSPPPTKPTSLKLLRDIQTKFGLEINDSVTDHAWHALLLLLKFNVALAAILNFH